MWQWLDNLRDRPPAARRHAAFLIALGITTMIFFVWVTTLPIRFEGGHTSLGIAEEERVAEVVKETGAITSVVKREWGRLRGLIESARGLVATSTVYRAGEQKVSE